MPARTRPMLGAFAAALIAAPCVAHPPAPGTLRPEGNRPAAHPLIRLGGTPWLVRTGMAVASAPIKPVLRPTTVSRGARAAANASIKAALHATAASARPTAATTGGSIERRSRSK